MPGPLRPRASHLSRATACLLPLVAVSLVATACGETDAPVDGTEPLTPADGGGLAITDPDGQGASGPVFVPPGGPKPCKTTADCAAAASPCHAAWCQPGVGCVYVPNGEGQPCNDGSPCTTVDLCAQGACVGAYEPGETWFAPGAGVPQALLALGDGYALAGEVTATDGSPRAVLARTDRGGKAVWTRQYGDAASRASAAVATAAGFALAGTRASDTVADAWLLRLDAQGEPVGQHSYGGADRDAFQAMARLPDHGFALAGLTRSFGGGKEDAFLVRTDAEGQALWQQAYGSHLNDEAHAVLAMPDGGFLLVGHTWKPSAGNEDAWVVRTDAMGTALWTKTYGGTGSDVANAVVAVADGGFAIAGFTTSTGAGKSDAWLLRFDADGHLVWQRTFGGGQHDKSQALAGMADGGFALFGYTASTGAGKFDYWLLRTDANGRLHWHHAYGAAGNDKGLALAALAAGGFVLAGTSDTALGEQTWLVRTDGWGHKSCATQGTCAKLALQACDDGDPCTVEACDAVKGCQHLPPSPAVACPDGCGIACE